MKKFFLFASLLIIFLKINIVFSNCNIEVHSISPHVRVKGSLATIDKKDCTKINITNYSDRLTKQADDFTLITKIETDDQQHLCGVLQVGHENTRAMFRVKPSYYTFTYTAVYPQHPVCNNAKFIVSVEQEEDTEVVSHTKSLHEDSYFTIYAFNVVKLSVNVLDKKKF